jgi:hypothetical protein
METPVQVQLIRLLLRRLERVSVDSYWAHRASGLRGSLLRGLELIEAGQPIDEPGLQQKIDAGFGILERAAPHRPRLR